MLEINQETLEIVLLIYLRSDNKIWLHEKLLNQCISGNKFEILLGLARYISTQDKRIITKEYF